MAQRHSQVDPRAVADHIVHHPHFAEMVAGASRDEDSGAPRPQSHRRNSFPTPDAEIAAVWKGRSTTYTSRKGKGIKTRDQKSTGSARKASMSGTFPKDVVLLLWPSCKTVQTHSKRVKLYDSGFILNLFEIHVEWDEAVLLHEIAEAFAPKLRDCAETLKYYSTYCLLKTIYAIVFEGFSS